MQENSGAFGVIFQRCEKVGNFIKSIYKILMFILENNLVHVWFLIFIIIIEKIKFKVCEKKNLDKEKERWEKKS